MKLYQPSKETENEIKVNNIIKNNENNMIEENKIEETSNEILSPDKQPDLNFRIFPSSY